MGEENKETNVENTNTEQQNKNIETEKKGKTYTEEELNTLLSNEKKSGKMDFLKELGVQDESVLKTLIEENNKKEEENKTEIQKANETNVRLDNELKEEKTKRMLLETKLEAIKLGAKPETVDDLVSLALAKVTDEKNVNSVIGELKVSYPNFFSDSKEEKEEEQKKNRGTRGNYTRTDVEKGKEQNQENKSTLAERLFSRGRKNNSSKENSSYFKVK